MIRITPSALGIEHGADTSAATNPGLVAGVGGAAAVGGQRCILNDVPLLTAAELAEQLVILEDYVWAYPGFNA